MARRLTAMLGSGTSIPTVMRRVFSLLHPVHRSRGREAGWERAIRSAPSVRKLGGTWAFCWAMHQVVRDAKIPPAHSLTEMEARGQRRPGGHVMSKNLGLFRRRVLINFAFRDPKGCVCGRRRPGRRSLAPSPVARRRRRRRRRHGKFWRTWRGKFWRRSGELAFLN